MSKTYDLAIVGGGPAGLYAAYYAGMREMSCCIIDAMPGLGGRLTALFPEKPVYDVAGFPKIRARQLAQQFVEQAQSFPFDVFCEETVTHIQKIDSENFLVQTNKQTHKARRVLLACGIGSFSARKLTLSEASAFENRGLYYHVNSPEMFRNKNIVIAGGGDSAFDWALELEHYANSVTLIHRSDKFRAHPATVSQVKNHPRIRLLTSREITKLTGENQLQSLTIYNKLNQSEETLNCDALLVFFGFISDTSFLEQWGLAQGPEMGTVKVNARMETSVPGIYAAGDIAWHDGKIKLITTACAEAAIAVNFAKHSLDPASEIQPIYSTSLMEDKSL